MYKGRICDWHQSFRPIKRFYLCGQETQNSSGGSSLFMRCWHPLVLISGLCLCPSLFNISAWSIYVLDNVLACSIPVQCLSAWQCPSLFNTCSITVCLTVPQPVQNLCLINICAWQCPTLFNICLPDSETSAASQTPSDGEEETHDALLWAMLVPIACDEQLLARSDHERLQVGNLRKKANE